MGRLSELAGYIPNLRLSKFHRYAPIIHIETNLRTPTGYHVHRAALRQAGRAVSATRPERRPPMGPPFYYTNKGRLHGLAGQMIPNSRLEVLEALSQSNVYGNEVSYYLSS